MRVASLAIGIVGGVFGIICAVLALAVGGIGNATHAHGSGEVVVLGWLALGFALFGILGAGLVMGKPRLGSGILFVSAIGITVSISAFAVLAAPLFLIAALLGFLGRRNKEGAIAPQPAVPL